MARLTGQLARKDARWLTPLVGHATTAVAPAAARHLVIGTRNGWQSHNDLRQIVRHIGTMDPTIRVFVVETEKRNSVLRRDAAARPTLVVSNGLMPTFVPMRGKVYQGSLLPKLEELQRLEAAGLPIPKYAELTPSLVLDPAEWGEFVILKPTHRAFSSHGMGIQLIRTSRVRYRAPAEYAWNHPGRYGPMIVQQFIDTGEHITVCRVLTLFGEPLYAMADRTEERRVSLTASDAEIEAAPIASQLANENEAYLVYEKRILDLARSAHAAIPEVPLKGCDVIQDVNTGKLYLLEVNCGGNTWHFSSEQQAEEREYTGRDFAMRRYLQFDGLRTAARVLVARTNAEAE